MPKRSDIHHILIIGAGPIVIGQACEFDYSGTQACKALISEGYQVTLINSNPATIMTDPQTANQVYIEPITPELVERIIEKEKPDAILPTVGGQTALNCCLALHQLGVLEKHDVEILGAKPEVIERAEDRRKFNEIMKKIGLEVPKNAIVSSLEDANYVLDKIGLPAIVRPSFTLGGSGGGIAKTKQEYENIVENGLALSPTHEVLIDESVLGWKEYEMEVIRDHLDNCMIVCSIENIDPMGMHTGDSMTVAPAQTLTDKEYQRMRDASIAVLRAVGVETGGSNVQFAVNPENGRILVIEMNPRVSRSSALASKATGFPIAKVAAKLAVGYSLDEIQNDITKITPASFEPTIDYVVTKIPRFAFEKFKGTPSVLSSSMRSVGEVMAIGRSFSESLQKALCSMEKGYTGLDVQLNKVAEDVDLSEKQIQSTINYLKAELKLLMPNRLLLLADALRFKIPIKELEQITGYDFWFIEQINQIVQKEHFLKNHIEQHLAHGSQKDQKSIFDLLGCLNVYQWVELKKMGFSDANLANIFKTDQKTIRDYRHQLDLHPVFKKIDTCAAEFSSHTPYLYSCYEGEGLISAQCESNVSDAKKVVILGSGPNRIGQGLEFDYACTHAALAISDAGFESIMINCNPETVSTDYDTSDKLYFEPLDLEHVVEILLKERQKGELLGVIVQLGGQTPLKLAEPLQDLGFPIIGTSPDFINLAEDRKRFTQLLDQLGLEQPSNVTCNCVSEIEKAVEKVGYPVIIRPSNVLGGSSMEILNFPSDLKSYLDYHPIKTYGGSILVDKFLEDAMEIDVDALCDGQDVYIAGIMEHIERAGVHSGDSTSFLPTKNVSKSLLNQIEKSIESLGRALNVIGLMNVQYAIQDEKLYVLEVNPRASRTVPFVAKATGIPVAKIATHLMLGEKLASFNLKPVVLEHFAVKEVVFPFARFAVDDIRLRPEMQSTGEVMGIADSFEQAFYKAQLGAGYDLKMVQNVFVDFSAKYESSSRLLIEQLISARLHVCVPSHIYKALDNQYPAGVSELNYQDVLARIKAGEIHLLLDISATSSEAKNIRKAAYFYKVPHATTLEVSQVMVKSLQSLESHQIQVKSMQAYFA